MSIDVLGFQLFPLFLASKLCTLDTGHNDGTGVVCCVGAGSEKINDIRDEVANSASVPRTSKTKMVTIVAATAVGNIKDHTLDLNTHSHTHTYGDSFVNKFVQPTKARFVGPVTVYVARSLRWPQWTFSHPSRNLGNHTRL